MQALALYAEHHSTARQVAAQRLRELADMIATGEFVMGTHRVALPAQVSFKIEMDREPRADDVYEIELGVRWQPWEKMGSSDIAAT